MDDTLDYLELAPAVDPAKVEFPISNDLDPIENLETKMQVVREYDKLISYEEREHFD